MPHQPDEPISPDVGGLSLDSPDFAERIAERARRRASEHRQAVSTNNLDTPTPNPSVKPVEVPRDEPITSNPPPVARPEPVPTQAREQVPASSLVSPRPSVVEQKAEQATPPPVADHALPAARPTPQPQAPVRRVLPSEQPIVKAVQAPEATVPTVRAIEKPRAAELPPRASEPADALLSDAGQAGHEIDYGAINPRLRSLIEWAVVVAGALAVALIIKSFLLQAYYIPSPSMEQTLVEDDRVLVNKLSKAANRGDVMVFKRPVIQQGQPEDLIKRVIATAGETVEVRGGTIYIDGKELVEPYIGEGVVTNGPVWTENCANDSSEQNSCLVPEGHIFMMGDNRGNSQDSRRFGPIDTDLVVGRAFLKVWPLGDITAL